MPNHALKELEIPMISSSVKALRERYLAFGGLSVVYRYKRAQLVSRLERRAHNKTLPNTDSAGLNN